MLAVGERRRSNTMSSQNTAQPGGLLSRLAAEARRYAVDSAAGLAGWVTHDECDGSGVLGWEETLVDRIDIYVENSEIRCERCIGGLVPGDALIAELLTDPEGLAAVRAVMEAGLPLNGGPANPDVAEFARYALVDLVQREIDSLFD